MDTAEYQHPNAATLKGRWVLTAVGVLGLIATSLLLIPFAPNMPTGGLDPSWALALNIAVAHGLVFGKDLIFTFGPLGSVYTHVYSPWTDAIVMAASIVYAVAFASAFMLVAWPRRVVVGIAIPFIIGSFFVHDPAFIALPLFFLYACARLGLPETSPLHLRLTWIVRCVLGLISIALGMLPIIKGSFVGVVVPVAGLSLILVARRDLYLALVLALAGVASTYVWWAICGQPLAALPAYFIAQSPIVSGYTEAMSIDNGLLAPFAFAAASFVMCLIVALRMRREEMVTAVIVTLATAWTLFVSFKAAFVRHDLHAFIAAGALLLIACAVICVARPAQAAIAAVMSIVVAVVTVQSGLPANMTFNSGVLQAEVISTWNGIRARVRGDDFSVQYRAALDSIGRADPLPKVSGGVDVFPVDLAAIFANGLEWKGRPVFQSYSAYTPGLLKANADFLRSAAAPEHVFFTSFPIDNRPLVMDDSLSQLALLDRYHVAGREGRFVHFVKAESGRAQLLDSTTTTGRWGEPVKVGSGPMWVSVDVQQTLAGRLLEAAFKPPQLEIDFTLENGTVVRHRYVPKIGQAGFIVSPYLGDEGDFADLAEGRAPRYPVRSFTLVSSHGALWKDSFVVKETPIRIGQ